MSDDVKRVFAKRLNYFMEINNMNQVDIINAIGVSSSTVSDWSLGKKVPRMGRIQTLAELLGVEMTDLLDEDKEQPPTGNKKYLLDKIDNMTDTQIAKLNRIADVLKMEDENNL